MCIRALRRRSYETCSISARFPGLALVCFCIRAWAGFRACNTYQLARGMELRHRSVRPQRSNGSQASIRGLVGYGFTPHLTLSFTLPAVVTNTTLPPTRIQPGDDFDSTLSWRFQHRATKVGTRFESTAFAGLAVPGPQSGFKGVAHTTNAPGTMFGAVTGMASRSHYVWLGSTYTRFFEHDGDKRPDVLDYSLVYGYRPPKWRRPPDKWDWRLFGELVGERSHRFLEANTIVAGRKRIRSSSAPRRSGFITTTP